MKTIAIVMAGLCLASQVKAANINQGNWEVRGNFNLSHEESPYYWRSSMTTSVSVGGGAEYFFADQLSAGLNASYSVQGKRTGYFSLGPVITKYFLVSEKMAPYVSAVPIGVGKREGIRAQAVTSIRPGVKFFLTESVAVGPALEYEHDWSYNRDRIRLLGLFSIHL